MEGMHSLADRIDRSGDRSDALDLSVQILYGYKPRTVHCMINAEYCGSVKMYGYVYINCTDGEAQRL